MVNVESRIQISANMGYQRVACYGCRFIAIDNQTRRHSARFHSDIIDIHTQLYNRFARCFYPMAILRNAIKRHRRVPDSTRSHKTDSALANLAWQIARDNHA